MPRKPSFKCSICGKVDYKKNLWTSSLDVIEHEKDVKIVKHYKSGLLCSRKCYDKWVLDLSL